MALSGSVSTGEMEGRSMSLQWTASQSVTSNTSTVTWKVVATGSYSSGVMVREITAKINGNQVYHTDNLGTKLSAGTVVASGTVTISHNADGTGSFSAYIGAGIYYQWSINTENSATFTLNTIARSSTVSISDFELGDKVTIKIASASTGFNHTVSYSYCSLDADIFINQTGKTSYSLTWDTSSLIESWAAQRPNQESEWGTIICKTYSGSTLIGTNTTTFTTTLKNSYIPTMDSLSIALDNSANSVINGWGLAVAGFTKAKLTGAASGILSSTIKRFDISGGYDASVSGDSLEYTGSSLTGGDLTFSVIAVDSRNRKSSAKSVSQTVYDYILPSISSFSAGRTTSDATKIVVNAAWDITSLNGKNSSSATVKYRVRGSTNWSTSSQTIANGSVTTLSETFDVSKSYELMLVVTDAVGKESAASAKVSTQEVFLDWRAGGTGLGIGKMVEDDYSVELNPDWTFKTHGSEILELINSFVASGIASLGDYIVEQGTSNDWVYRKYNSGVMEAWTKVTGTSTGATNHLNMAVAYPEGLLTAKSANVSVGSTATIGAECHYVNCENSNIDIWAYPASKSGASVWAYVHVIGTWK